MSAGSDQMLAGAGNPLTVWKPVMTDLPELTPQNYVQHTSLSIWQNLPMIVASGLIFSLCCAPFAALAALGLVGPAIVVAIVTVAPAWAAMLHLESELAQGGHVDFGVEGRMLSRYAGDSIRLAVPLAFFSLGILWLLPALNEATVRPYTWVAFALCIVGFVGLSTFYLYAFPLLVQHDQESIMALRNGALLASRYAVNSVGLLAMGILCALAIRFFSLALLFFLPALYGMFVTNNCLLVVELEKTRTE
jgi:uncharacterized membrane protein YesL